MARDILSPINITYDENGNVVPVRCNYIAKSVAGTGPRPSLNSDRSLPTPAMRTASSRGVNPGPEDWEKYYTGGSSVANNAVSDLDDIMTKNPSVLWRGTSRRRTFDPLPSWSTR